jgi:hypothetical protein
MGFHWIASVPSIFESAAHAAAVASISSSHFSSNMPVMMVVSAMRLPSSASSFAGDHGKAF